MPFEPDFINRLVRNNSGTYYVSCKPKGSALRDLTNGSSVRWVQWFQIGSGILSVIGWLLHHTVFRSAWVIRVQQHPGGTPIIIGGLRKKQALATFERVLEAVRNDQSLDSFTP